MMTMTRGLVTFFTFVSIIFFPWPLAAALALISSFSIPLLPLAAGIFADTLYYAPHAGLPIFSLSGALVTAVAFFVRSRLKASTMVR